MAYIISVNATILSATGGTCVCQGTTSDPICSFDAAYAACKVIFAITSWMDRAHTLFLSRKPFGEISLHRLLLLPVSLLSSWVHWPTSQSLWRPDWV